jgi:chromosome segregation ATPase
MRIFKKKPKKEKLKEDEVDSAAEDFLHYLKEKPELTDVEKAKIEIEQDAFAESSHQKTPVLEPDKKEIQSDTYKNIKKLEQSEDITAKKQELKAALEETDLLETLKHLSTELKEYEKIKENLRTKVEMASGLALKLNERKEQLIKDVYDKQQKLPEISDLILKLQEKKEDFTKDIKSKQEEKELLEKKILDKQAKVEELGNMIPKLDRNKEKLQKIILENQDEITKIDEQTKQILNLRKYFM